MYTIYGAEWCVVCHKAKDFCKLNNIEFNYIDIEEGEMPPQSFKTIPQIYLGDKHIGWFDDFKKTLEI